MLWIGLLVVVVALAASAWLVASSERSDQTIQLALEGWQVGIKPLNLVILSLVLPIIFVVGILLIRLGARRMAAHRRERKAERAELKEFRRTTGNIGPIPTESDSASRWSGSGAGSVPGAASGSGSGPSSGAGWGSNGETQSMPGSSSSTTAFPQAPQDPRP